VISPLVLVHPAEEYVEKIDEEILFHWEFLFVIVQFSYYLIGNVNYVYRLLGLPVVVVVFLLHEKFDVVYETIQNLLVLRAPSHYPQEMAGHVLAALVPVAELKITIVSNMPIHDRLLELLNAVVVDYRLVLLVVLS
jgi:hypothetical protein